MTVTTASFRTSFPEFSDATAYPDGQVTLWIGLGTVLLNADRFASILDFATQLYVAHQLVVWKRSQSSADVGGIPGEVVGPKSAKTVDKVSANYDTSAVTFADAGFWNMTTYGIQLYQLIQMFGAGGVQIGAGGGSGEANTTDMQWLGWV